MACVHGLDLGRLLDALEAKGITNKTLVIFLSDNGGTINTYSNNTPLRGYKYMFGESGIRVPLIVSWPGRLPAGRTIDGLVTAMDLFPTIAPLLEAQPPDGLDGRSFFFEDLLTWNNTVLPAPPHQELCWSSGKGDWVIHRGSWKLINSTGWDHAAYRLVDGRAEPAPNDTYPAGLLLCDLARDPGERENLADQHPEKVRELKAAWESWRSRMGEPVRGRKRPDRYAPTRCDRPFLGKTSQPPLRMAWGRQ